MTAHRFRIQIGGRELHGLAFDSEAELERFIIGRGLALAAAAPAPSVAAAVAEPEPSRRRGRPGHAAAIAAAVRQLGEAGRAGIIADRARLVLRALAEKSSGQDLPSVGTVRRFLSENSAVQNSIQNSVQKSNRATSAAKR